MIFMKRICSAPQVVASLQEDSSCLIHFAHALFGLGFFFFLKKPLLIHFEVSWGWTQFFWSFHHQIKNAGIDANARQ